MCLPCHRLSPLSFIFSLVTYCLPCHFVSLVTYCLPLSLMCLPYDSCVSLVSHLSPLTLIVSLITYLSSFVADCPPCLLLFPFHFLSPSSLIVSLVTYLSPLSLICLPLTLIVSIFHHWLSPPPSFAGEDGGAHEERV